MISPPAGASFWPAVGLGIGALLLSPRRLWPAILVTIVVAGSTANLLHHLSLPACLGLMCAQALQTAVSAWLITRLCGTEVSFHRAREVMVLICCASIVNALTALPGAWSASTTFGTEFGPAYQTWLTGNGLGTLIAVPLVVAWIRPLLGVRTFDPRLAAETAAFIGLWSYVVWLILGRHLYLHPYHLHPYILVSLLAWPAYRLGQRGMSAALLILAVASASDSSVLMGASPFGGETAAERLLVLHAFIGLTSVGGLLITARRSEALANADALRLSEQTFRNVVETLPMAIYISTGVDQVCEYISPGMVELFGYSREDIPTVAAWWPLAYPDPQYRRQLSAEWNRKVERAINDQTPIEPMETLVTCRDGSQKLISWGFVTMGGKNYAIGVDLTARKEAEAALRQSEHKARAILDTAFEFIGLLTPEGIVIDVNNSALEFSGLTRSEVLGRPFTQTAWWSHSPEMRANLSQAIESAAAGNLARFEATHYAADSALHHIDFSIKPVKDDEGQVIWLIPEGRDITDRKNAETELRNAAHYSRRLIEACLDPLVTISPDGMITDVNTATERITGKQREELVGSDFSTYFTDPMSARSGYQQAFEQGQVTDYPLSVRHVSGQITDVLYNASVFRGEDGAIQGVFASARDITERRRAQQLLEARLRLSQFAESHSLDELLVATLDECELLTGSRIGFYHFVDDDRQMLTLQAWSTQTSAVFCKAEAAGMEYSADQAGVWVDALRERRSVIHNDYAALTHRRGMPEGHAEVLREMVVPVFRGQRIVSILGVGNKPTEYDQRDEATVVTLADMAWDFAERKRSEAALRESEQRLRTVFDTATDAIVVIDEGGMIETFNASAERMLGYRSAEVVGRDLTVLMPEQWQSRHALGMSRFLESGEKQVIGTGAEVECLRCDGRVIPVELQIETMKIGGQRKFLGMLRDITERKRAESMLRESEARFRSIISSSPVPMALNDETQRITYLNQAFTQTFGYTLEDIPTLSNWWPLAYPDPEYRSEVAGKWRAELAFAAENGGAFRPIELVVQCRNGSSRTVLASASSLAGSYDSEHLVVLYDITDRKLAEDTLQESKSRLREIQAFRATVATYSHRLASPMTGILADLEYLREAEGLAATDQHERQAIIEEACAAAAQARGILLKLNGLSEPEYQDYLDHAKILSLDEN